MIKQALNSIYGGDCWDLMQDLPDESLDLVICDGPYGLGGQDWDRVGSIQAYNLGLIEVFARVLKPGGVLYLFGKPDCLDCIDYRQHLQLNGRIVWYQPSRLSQGRLSYTNNYDIIAYFSKGKPSVFNLEEIRVPQLVELSQRLRVERVPSVQKGRFGKTRFNRKGKNPGDVWGDIKQLTYHSKELLNREVLGTIQKPIRLIERLVLASSKPGDLVLDPFAGTGTTCVVCRRLGRNFLAYERNDSYVSMCRARLEGL